MKVSLNWLKKYTAIELPLDELVAKIGAQLGAVEEVIDQRGHHQGIVVVQIIEAKPHPNADKLNIYQMTDGRGQIQVVSGDRDLQIGDKVAWLAPGTTVPSTYGSAEPIMLSARAMRGEMSNGMFGSGKELGMNDDHERVLVLDTDAAPGTSLADAYELDDVIIDIENKMFTHRPDCFGLLGVARELAGIQGQPFTSPEWYLLGTGKLLRPTSDVLPLSIKNEIPPLCPQYQAVVLRDVQMGPSPILLQSYLKRVGIRPISNVVDVTNYLMYLTGQPLHAFDYDKVAAVDGKKDAAIVVRTPKQGETLTLLDGRTITPHAEAILICSRTKPIALGGVMGGLETEIDDCTKTVILEAASFNMYAIRKTSMEHGIFTDAVTRYSKGQSIAQLGPVLAEAVTLMGRYAGAQLATERGFEAPQPPDPVTVTAGFINDRLGTQLNAKQLKTLLEQVEMQVVTHGEHLRVTPGFWRTDIEIPEDVVEEIGRLHGYAQVQHELPLRPAAAVALPSIEQLKTSIRNLLAAAGNNELQTYSFVPEKLLQKAGQDSGPAYRLRNALSPELELIRTSLLPSLLDKVHANHKAGFEVFGLFEIGKSHNKYEIGDDQLPRERLGLSYVFSAEPKAAAGYAGAPFYQAKYVAEYLLTNLGLPVTVQPLEGALIEAWWLKNTAQLFEPKRSAVVLGGDTVLGIVGEYTTTVRRSFKLPDYCAGFELDLGLLHSFDLAPPPYSALLRFPATEQDICFKVPVAVTYDDLALLIAKHFVSDARLRFETQPVDIYQRPNEPGYKQMTYRLTLQHHDRTLTSQEVNEMIASLAQEAKKHYQAEQV